MFLTPRYKPIIVEAPPGTVSSVGLAAPAFLSVSGSPITSSGTLTLTLATQAANKVFAGPTTGADAAPTFRSLVTADMPAGTGTVTSVAVSAPSILSVAGSPVTSSGTIALTLANQSANKIFGGPNTGSAAAPTFRDLVNADMPADVVLRTLVDAKGDLLAGTANDVLARLAVGSDGKVLTADSGATAGVSWQTPGSGSGTVTSVALTVPSILSVAGSPITTSGTLAVTLASQSANDIFVAPDGSSGAPTFRHMLPADLPNSGAGANKFAYGAAGLVTLRGVATLSTGVTLEQYSTTASEASQLRFVRSKDGTISTGAAVDTNDILGYINFDGFGTAGAIYTFAQIKSAADATPGTNDAPGRITFHTCADGSATLTERLRIDKDGLSAFTGTVTISSTLGVTGVATLTAKPVLSSVTASTILSADSGKGVVSVTNGTSGYVLTSTGTSSLPTFQALPSGGSVTDVSVVTANGVSGSVANSTTTPAITLTLGAITPTTVNKVTITAPATSATLTILNGKTLTVNNTITLAGTDSKTYTFPTTDATIARTDAAQTFTGTQTIGALVATTVNGNTFTTGSGTLTIAASKTLTVNNTITLAGTDAKTYTFPSTDATIARTDAAQTFTGVQTLSSAPILSALTASRAVFTDGSKALVSNAITGSGNVVMSTSPTLVTPVLGAASATSITFGDSVLSNYKEGTWTPTPSNYTGTNTFTGTYTRIGNYVFFSVSITTTDSIGSTNNSSYFSGPPGLAPSFSSTCDSINIYGVFYGTQIAATTGNILTPTFNDAYGVYVTGFYRL